MMKLIQKIMSHGLLIAFLVAGFFLYLHRAEIFPQWFDSDGGEMAAAQQAVPAPERAAQPAEAGNAPQRSPVESVQGDRYPQPPPIVAVAPPPANTAAVPANASADTQSASAAAQRTAQEPAVTAGAPTPVAAPENSADTTPAARAQTATDTPAGTGATAEDAVQSTATAVAGTPATATPAAQPSTSSPEPEPAAAASEAAPGAVASAPGAGAAQPASGGDAAKALLDQARAAYWRRDVSAAAAAYRRLGEARPDDADVWGEIGNFYFSLRQREQAAEAYARSLSVLIDNGEHDRARQLLGVLYELDADQARAMEQKLRQTGS